MPIGSMRFAIRAEYVRGLRRSKAVLPPRRRTLGSAEGAIAS